VHRLRRKRRERARQRLQPCSRRTVRDGRKKDGFGVVGVEEVALVLGLTGLVCSSLTKIEGGEKLPTFN
jgi:hypothetical protein